MESPKNTHIQLRNLGVLLKEKMAFVAHEQEQITGLKEEIREVMKGYDLNNFEVDEVTIKLTRSYAFDIGMFKLEEPEVSKNFIKEETTTKTKDVLDKKALKRLLPVTYKRFLIELTPRLRVT